jgi:formylglycine-generating enzyme required for sulfatase activity
MRMILGVYGDLGDLSKLLADARAAAAPIPSTPVAQPVSSVAPVINMAFVTIPAGTFQMGSLGSEVGRYSNEALHTVTISRSFEMQTTTITQRQWFDVMGNNPSDFKDQKYCKNDYVVISGVSLCPNNPVEQIFWNDAQGFIQKLNARGDGYVYRLPTEAEWEYAARAGTQTAYFFGNDVSQLGNYAWFDGNSGSQTHAVATKPANGFGLYDMHGNVWQWVQDWYGGDYSSGSVIDPSGPSSGANRVFRGGCWSDGARYLRAAFRFSRGPDYRHRYVGARLVRTAAEQR